MRFIDRINQFFARRRALKALANLYLSEYGDPKPVKTRITQNNAQGLIPGTTYPLSAPNYQVPTQPITTEHDPALEHSVNQLVNEINSPVYNAPAISTAPAPNAAMNIINRKAEQIS